MFLGRISAETCLKMNYFGSTSQKSPSAGAPPPTPVYFNNEKINNLRPYAH